MSIISDLSRLSVDISNITARLNNFDERIRVFGLEGVKKFYGAYRGIVLDNKDPLESGRVLAYCPEVGHELGNYPKVWIDPVLLGAGDDRGLLSVPEIGDSVRVLFCTGNTGLPIAYLGGRFGGAIEVPVELEYSASGYPECKGFVTRMGHAVWLSDEPGSEEINITWHKADPSDPAADTSKPENRSLTSDRTIGDRASIAIKPDGSIILTSKTGASITITDKSIDINDNNGNTLVADSSGIIVTDLNDNVIRCNSSGVQVDAKQIALGSGASHPIPFGDMLLLLFNAHTHPSAVGPTGPPVLPLTPDILSTVTKTA